MGKEKEKKHPAGELRKLFTLALVLLLLAALCFGTGYLIGGGKEEKTPELSAVVVQNRLEQMSQLATAKYYYTSMGKFEDSDDFYGMKIPFSGKHFIVSYDGSVLAGVDLGSSRIKVNGDRITVTLPEAQIMSHEIDSDSLKIFDETKNIFNPITMENYNDFFSAQKKEMEAKAVENGLLVQAAEQAELAVRQVVSAVVDSENVEIVIDQS